jgi:hypothetical protein
MKEAQQFSAGKRCKRHVRPGRDDRIARLLVLHAASQVQGAIDRPIRDLSSEKIPAPSTRVPGYFRRAPSGQIPSST